MLISFQSIEQLIRTQGHGPLCLEPDAVHLWGVELDGSSHSFDQCVGWLDEEERRRANHLIHAENRRYYVLAHGGLRAVLGRYLRLAPDQVAMDRRAAGKPFLKTSSQDGSGITFNLSHAHGRALIAVSKAQEVGVDLECVRSEVDVTKLSARYFAPSEHASIMLLPEEIRSVRFFRYWVAKEAMLKAQGVGLRGLSDCEVVFDQEELNRDVQVRLGSQFTAPLRVRLLACGEGWEAAVAAQNLDIVKQGG